MNRERAQTVIALLASCLLAACSSDSEPSAIERGEQLFSSKALSSSILNDYTCASCHDSEYQGPQSKKTGAPLAGVTLRPSFWGGQEAELLRSINDCRNYFMVDNRPLVATDADARSLYAYLQSLEPGDETAQAFTPVNMIEALPRGDADSGNQLFLAACASCHGTLHQGDGRLSARVPILPEDTLATHTQYTPRVQRLIFTEKMRHGSFSVTAARCRRSPPSACRIRTFPTCSKRSACSASSYFGATAPSVIHFLIASACVDVTVTPPP